MCLNSYIILSIFSLIKLMMVISLCRNNKDYTVSNVSYFVREHANISEMKVIKHLLVDVIFYCLVIYIYIYIYI